MEYKKLTKASMPPVSNSQYFILWRAANETDGGFPALAKRVQYDGKAPYIRYVKAFEGWVVLGESEYKTCLWAELEAPERVKAKWEKARQKQDDTGDPLLQKAV